MAMLTLIVLVIYISTFKKFTVSLFVRTEMLMQMPLQGSFHEHTKVIQNGWQDHGQNRHRSGNSQSAHSWEELLKE